MKRTVLALTGLIALLLAACAPSAQVATNVVPTLISVSTSDSEGVVLQGRYFGNGGEGSFVLVSADVDGEDGVVVDPTSWSSNRISFRAPEDAGPGFVFVVVDDVMSNGLPADLD